MGEQNKLGNYIAQVLKDKNILLQWIAIVVSLTLFIISLIIKFHYKNENTFNTFLGASIAIFIGALLNIINIYYTRDIKDEFEKNIIHNIMEHMDKKIDMKFSLCENRRVMACKQHKNRSATPIGELIQNAKKHIYVMDTGQ